MAPARDCSKMQEHEDGRCLSGGCFVEDEGRSGRICEPTSKEDVFWIHAQIAEEEQAAQCLVSGK